MNKATTQRLLPDNPEIQNIIHRYCSGETESFRMFYESAKTVVFQIAYHFTGNTEAAKDLSQEIWVKIWKHLCSFRGEARWTSWVYRIAPTTYLDKKRSFIGFTNRQIIRKETNNADDTQWKSEYYAMSETTTEINAEVYSDLSLIGAALERLSQSERLVFISKHTFELTFKELALELGVSEGTVKTLHFRALKKLYTLLVVHYPELQKEVEP